MKLAIAAVALTLAAPVSAQLFDKAEAEAWIDCVLVNAAKNAAATDERADVLASAALGSCVAEQEAVYRRLLANYLDDYDSGLAVFNRFRENLRDQATSIVVEVRANKGGG